MQRFLALSLLVLSPCGFAQLAAPASEPLPSGAQRIRVSGPLQRARLDLDTGALTTGELALSGSTLCLDNTLDENDFSVDALLYPAGDELLDWGVKSCGGSGFVDKVVVRYSSQADPVWQGGPGASLDVLVYGDSFGYGEPGTELFSVSLTGLPSSGPPPFPGCCVEPREIELELGSQSFFLPDGPVGWGLRNQDGLTAAILVDANPATGTENAYDVYSGGPAGPGTYQGTFTLPPGGTSNDPLENSFWFQLWQNDTPATLAPIAAAPNPDALSAPAPAIVGASWYPVVATQGFADPTATAVLVSGTRLAGTATPWGTLIVDPATQLAPVSVRPGSLHQFDLPSDANLVGRTFYAQGGVFDGVVGFQLTNALELHIGTF